MNNLIWARRADGSHVHYPNGNPKVCWQNHPKAMSFSQKMAVVEAAIIFLLLAHLILKAKGY